MKRVIANVRDLEWVEGPYPKVKMKVFPSEMDSGTYTILLNVPPGAVLERHDEPLNEVFYVLSGTVSIEGKQYSEGTYYFTPAGRAHGPFETEDGCLVLVTKFSR
ncbi:MAG: cupin domain-containing protein [Candidatus Hydrogenedentota bacterium]|nr:MAG: cupin domain-containing protein [Candidatus Hydrogenedentota bacterium]